VLTTKNTNIKSNIINKKFRLIFFFILISPVLGDLETIIHFL